MTSRRQRRPKARTENKSGASRRLRTKKHEIIWQTSIRTTAEAEEAVAELLAANVAPGPSAYTDADTGVTTVSVYDTQSPKNSKAVKAALRDGLAELRRCGLEIGRARISIRKLPRENWAESWKRHFPPLEIGRELLVKPSWNRRRPQAGQAMVVLDPGLSFGTGQHPTTEFCLHAIVTAGLRPAVEGGVSLPGKAPRMSRDSGRSSGLTANHASGRRAGRAGSTAGGTPATTKPRSFLDIGTGSGILAIAASKLGFAPVHAFDFDPQCVVTARANAKANRVQNKLRLNRADLTRLPRQAAKRYDVVCANLLANLLIAERDRILARVKVGGVLIIAGILKREFHEVQQAYEQAGLKLISSKAQREWRSGAFRMHAATSDR